MATSKEAPLQHRLARFPMWTPVSGSQHTLQAYPSRSKIVSKYPDRGNYTKRQKSYVTLGGANWFFTRVHVLSRLVLDRSVQASCVPRPH
jgi:hypothetical protein